MNAHLIRGAVAASLISLLAGCASIDTAKADDGTTQSAPDVGAHAVARSAKADDGTTQSAPDVGAHAVARCLSGFPLPTTPRTSP